MLSICHTSSSPQITPNMMARLIPTSGYTSIPNCLQQHSSNLNIKGITLEPNCPSIHALLFADDLIICGQATREEAARINSVLQTFYATSGQMPNHFKSSITFKGYWQPFGQPSIWSTPWCPIWQEIYDHIKLPVTVPNMPKTISDLWNDNTHH